MGIAAAFANKTISPEHFRMILIATAIDFFGIILVTIVGNVPLNQILEKTDLANSNSLELQTLRERFEHAWNRYHLIRVLASMVSFALLVITAINKLSIDIKNRKS